MKRTTHIVAAAVLAATVSGCRGGEDHARGAQPTTTPSAPSIGAGAGYYMSQSRNRKGTGYGARTGATGTFNSSSTSDERASGNSDGGSGNGEGGFGEAGGAHGG